ncbi:MAG: symmetrical bis(5'-nucleosyl)-tetraphosphatase [Betaproteobacteria bacterium]|nr:MAG: symmetrical bis(5'-nucleosyl)-tetraphosphatase [Betaproteobacteria bacterium]
MATYAIGDIQGCFEALEQLLERIEFDPVNDRLWFVGDLVNRGPDSLAALRFVKDLGDRAVTVLGNHDLHLLTVAAGFAHLHRGDTLKEILEAPDRDDLLHWLRTRKLMHADEGWTMVHAGLLPQWSISQALELAREVEAALAGPGYLQLLQAMYGNQPDAWHDDLAGHDRHRVIINAMTRLRLCTRSGKMEFQHKTAPRRLPAGYFPWYAVPGRASAGQPIIFGHWSTLGLHASTDVVALDSGCLWGNALSAMRLHDRKIFQVSCAGMRGTTAPE